MAVEFQRFNTKSNEHDRVLIKVNMNVASCSRICTPFSNCRVRSDDGNRPICLAVNKKGNLVSGRPAPTERNFPLCGMEF